MKNKLMSINSPPGTKVRFTHPYAGYPSQSQLVMKHLTPQQIYTVNHTEVFTSSTDVYLEEVPNIPFNSVHFSEV